MRALFVLLVLAAAACSTGTESTVKPLEDSVVAYTAAFANGNDSDAWALVSSRCQTTVVEADYRASVRAAGRLYPTLKATDIKTTVKGSQAKVSYATGVTAVGSYQDQRWVLERAGWRWDACSAVG